MQRDVFSSYYQNNDFTLTDLFKGGNNNEQRDMNSPTFEYQRNNEESQFLSNNISHFQKDAKNQSENNSKATGKKKKKFNKGLKMLSVIVKDIVIEREVSTYKKVADIILKDSIKCDNLNLSSK